MIEHALLLIVSGALVIVLNSRVSWHYRYTRRISASRKETAERKTPQSTRAVSSRPYRSAPERIEDRQGELLVSALVNLGAKRKDALEASRRAINECPTRDFDSLLRMALRRFQPAHAINTPK